MLPLVETGLSVRQDSQEPKMTETEKLSVSNIDPTKETIQLEYNHIIDSEEDLDVLSIHSENTEIKIITLSDVDSKE